MGYKIELTKRIDLGDLGTDNSGNPFFVVITNINALSYEKKINYLASVSQAFSGMDVEKVKAGDLQSFSIDETKIEAMQKSVKGLIRSWNLLDLDGNPVDLKDDNALNRVPGVVVERIFAEMGDKQQEEETKNS